MCCGDLTFLLVSWRTMKPQRNTVDLAVLSSCSRFCLELHEKCGLATLLRGALKMVEIEKCYLATRGVLPLVGSCVTLCGYCACLDLSYWQ